MSRVGIVKKSVFYVLVIFYDIISLLWCYIISSNFVYNLTEIQKRGPGITIIGGADLPTWGFIIGDILGCACSVLFVLLSLSTMFLLTVSIFKQQITIKLNVLICIFMALTLIIYMLIPAQTYAVSLYILVRKLSFLKYLQFIYIIISLIIIVTNILVAVKRRRTTQ
ncbi:MAG: hypothetical protein J6D52_01865 [Clostridia bacterium]|nr:hypothetical protein [Clostridia bacterium]